MHLLDLFGPGGREAWHWPPAGIRHISGIQKVETLNFVLLGLNCVNLNKFGRNSFFYKTSGPHYRFQQIRDVFFLLSSVLNIFFRNKKVSFF